MFIRKGAFSWVKNGCSCSCCTSILSSRRNVSRSLSLLLWHICVGIEGTGIRAAGSGRNSNRGNNELITLSYCLLFSVQTLEDPFAPRYKRWVLLVWHLSYRLCKPSAWRDPLIISIKHREGTLSLIQELAVWRYSYCCLVIWMPPAKLPSPPHFPFLRNRKRALGQPLVSTLEGLFVSRHATVLLHNNSDDVA